MSKDNFKNQRFELIYAFASVGQIGFLVITIILIFLFLGKWIDKIFNSFPLFFLISALIGVIAASYSVYKFYVPLTEKRK